MEALYLLVVVGSISAATNVQKNSVRYWKFGKHKVVLKN